METTYLGWRAWYADGRVFDSKSARWDDMPDIGLQVVMVYYAEEYAPGKHYRMVLHGDDVYDYGGKPVAGSLMPDAEFGAMLDAAMAAVEW